MSNPAYEVKYIAESPESALTLLEKFTTSKEGVARFAAIVINEVEEGRVDALRVALFMKTLEKIKESVNEVLDKYYVSEARKYGEKPFDFRGAQFQVGDVGVKYDYSTCGHPGWNDLEKIIVSATEQQKEIEPLLKALTAPAVLVIEGEAVTVNPPVRKGKQAIKITIK